jgi:hypothetical protein
MMGERSAEGVLHRYATIVRELYERLVGAGRVVDAVIARGGLRGGVDRRRAIDIVWTLNSPDVYHLLRGGRGWSHDEYEDWLARALIDALGERR